MKVLIAGDWTENYLTLGGKVYHVGAEDLAVAKREANAAVADALAGGRAYLDDLRAALEADLIAARADIEAEIERRVQAEIDKIAGPPRVATPAIVAEPTAPAETPAP